MIVELAEARLARVADELAALGRGDHPLTRTRPPVDVFNLLDLGGPMPPDSLTVTIRVKPEMLARADRVADLVGADTVLGALAPAEGVSRSAIFRMALALGLEELERRYPGRPREQWEIAREQWEIAKAEEAAEERRADDLADATGDR